MQILQKQQSAGTNAVKKLRLKRLQLGHVFMINSKKLPAGQCYLEYPSGVIKLAAISGSKRDFEIIRDLTKTEILNLRREYNLY
jgi:hypothetical protein